MDYIYSEQQLFEIWAPREAVWSRWAKPILFAERSRWTGLDAQVDPGAWREMDLAWAAHLGEPCAIIVDLPGPASISTGLALAQRGYRPVPLYNCTNGSDPVVNVRPLCEMLQIGGDVLEKTPLDWDAPPAFLIDANRSVGRSVAIPGRFDNRWVVFPQDFPSANFLLSRNLRRVVVVQQGSETQRDLIHVLFRWREAGIQIECVGSDSPASPAPMMLKRPGRFGSLWYRALVILGLHRNSAGGFGDVVPEPQSSSGGYG